MWCFLRFRTPRVLLVRTPVVKYMLQYTAFNKICAQVSWCLLFFLLTYRIASSVVKVQISDVIYSANKLASWNFSHAKTNIFWNNRRDNLSEVMYLMDSQKKHLPNRAWPLFFFFERSILRTESNNSTIGTYVSRCIIWKLLLKCHNGLSIIILRRHGLVRNSEKSVKTGKMLLSKENAIDFLKYNSCIGLNKNKKINCRVHIWINFLMVTSIRSVSSLTLNMNILKMNF